MVVTKIKFNTGVKSISLNTKNLYADGNVVVTENNIIPNTTLDTKTFSVTNNGTSSI